MSKEVLAIVNFVFRYSSEKEKCGLRSKDNIFIMYSPNFILAVNILI